MPVPATSFENLLDLMTAPAVAHSLTLDLPIFQLITPHQTTFEAIVSLSIVLLAQERLIFKAHYYRRKVEANSIRAPPLCPRFSGGLLLFDVSIELGPLMIADLATALLFVSAQLAPTNDVSFIATQGVNTSSFISGSWHIYVLVR